MLAYHNKPELKLEVLAEMAMHREADNLVQGYGYWKDGKGCAVGCLIKGSDHSEYETKFGIPEMLARLEDTIFEGLPIEDARLWPERFLNAITIGADLSRVGYQFMYWNLTENLVLKDSDNKEVQKAIIQCRKAIKQCAEAICPLTKGEIFDESAAWSARSAAESAAWSARSAAESAAWSARSVAESAAWSARSAAESVAWSARSAAESVAWSVAESAAWSVAYIKMADKLIEILENAV